MLEVDWERVEDLGRVAGGVGTEGAGVGVGER